MNNKIQKCITLLTLISVVITGSFLYFPKTTSAQSESVDRVVLPPKPETPKTDDCFLSGGLDFLMNEALGFLSNQIGKLTGGLLGGEVPTNDKKGTFQITAGNIKACVYKIQEELLRVALVKFQKQLLDRITDDTIAWINGEDPKYFNDFGKLFSDSADSALGDTLSEVIGSNVCAPLKFQLNLELTQRQTPFTQQVSCTLGQIVGNIDNFQKNFSSGGWVGYNEVLKPQNNPFGIAFLTQQEILRKEQANYLETQARLTTSDGGFKPIEQCTQWGAHLNNKDGIAILNFPSIPPASDYPDPNNPPNEVPLPAPLQKEYKANQNAQVYWRCEKKIVTVPSVVPSAVTAKSFTSDSDYLVSSQDLLPYISAIFDSAINRLIKSGAEGLQSAFITSDNGAGRPPTTSLPDTPENRRFIKGVGDYKSSTSQKDQLNKKIDSLITESLSAISQADSVLQEIITINTDLSDATSTTTGYQLLSCETKRFGQQQACSNTTSVITIADSRSQQIEDNKITLDNFTALINQAKNRKSALTQEELTSLTLSIQNSLNYLQQSQLQSLVTLRTTLQTEQKLLIDDLTQCQKTSETYVCRNL